MATVAYEHLPALLDGFEAMQAELEAARITIQEYERVAPPIVRDKVKWNAEERIAALTPKDQTNYDACTD